MKPFAVLLGLLLSLGLHAEESADTLFLEMTDNSMLAIPQKYILERNETTTEITFTLLGDSVITISKSELAAEHKAYPYERPAFLSYKFNNKFNDQLFTDADTLEINPAQGLIRMQAACIGKRLTASFKVPDGVSAYVDGVEQVSKESRLRFEDPVTYTVAYPNQDIYRLVKLDDSQYSTTATGWSITGQVELTADMLSTNAPSNCGEDPGNILDGNVYTIFHSTWGKGEYTPLAWNGGTYYDGYSQWPYLQIQLPEPMSELQFSYITRTNSDRAPTGLLLQASNDGENWMDIHDFTSSEDDLPIGRGATYQSPTVELGASYKYLRFQLTESVHKNYLVMSEFAIYKVEPYTTENTKLWQVLPMKFSSSSLTTDDTHNAALSHLLDGNLSTACSLTCNTATGAWPYVQVEIPEPTYNLQFSYSTMLWGDVNGDQKVSIADVTELVNIILGKSQNPSEAADVNGDGNISIADVTELVNIILGKSQGGNAPLGIDVQGSTDGSTWTTLQTFTAEADGLPTTANATFVSPVIVSDVKYTSLRLQPTAGQDATTITLSEFSLSDVASCKRGLEPYGTNYQVQVDFLTDHPTSDYNVPRIDIWFGDSTTWSSSMWIGRYGQDYYEDAAIQIDGAGVFPDMARTEMQIKGRGNTSWNSSYSSKNPYRIKFPSKVKPFGMTKGKSWILLSNKQTGSMTSNALAMKVADMVESRGCNHIIPVELYVNNQYRGSYNFTEKVGFANNSIDIADETNAVMLELDTYYDESYKYKDTIYNLPINLKEPDLADDISDGILTYEDAATKWTQIQNAFNIFTKDTYNGGTAYLDVDAFVRAMLVTDLVRNGEYKHPKSWFIYNPDITQPDSLWNFGPVWDFDWAFGYDGTGKYFVNQATLDLFDGMSSSNKGVDFFLQLLRGTDTVKKAYYRLWTEFMESGKLQELIEYCDDYYEYANPSFVNNSTIWGDGYGYATHNENAKNWLETRANYIYQNLEVYDLSDDLLNTKEEQPATPILDVAEVMSRPVNVYSLKGILVRRGVPQGRCLEGLNPGIYIVNGKKYIIK